MLPATVGRPSSTSLHEVYRRKIWNSCVAMQILLDEEELQHLIQKDVQEIARSARARPFYTMASRTSYFPLLLTQLRRHYYSVFSALGETVEGLRPWLACDGVPLPWHYFIGHLYDEYSCWSRDRPVEGPWTLTLHLTDYPSLLLPGGAWNAEEGGGAIGAHFYSMLKQADYIRYGICKSVNALSKTEQTQLWDGVWTHSYEKFWHVNSKLLGDDPQRNWRGIPLRLYRGTAFGERKIMQMPLTFGDCTTMGDVLAKFALETHRVYCHGVRIPPDTPLSWVVLYFVYPDGFLHLVLVEDPPQ